VALELLVLGVIELELLSSESSELTEHLREHRRGEPAVFLRHELAEAIETVAALYRHQVVEVSRLGSSEHSEHLVDRQLLAAEGRGGSCGLCREQPGIRGQVHLRPIVGALDDKTGEAGVLLSATDGEPGLS